MIIMSFKKYSLDSIEMKKIGIIWIITFIFLLFYYLISEYFHVLYYYLSSIPIQIYIYQQLSLTYPNPQE